MFGFFTKIKTEIADLKQRFTTLEQKVESFFHKDEAPAATPETKPADASDAK